MLVLALYNLLNTFRRPTHLQTLRDLLLAHRVQWYKEPQFIDPSMMCEGVKGIDKFDQNVFNGKSFKIVVSSDMGISDK